MLSFGAKKKKCYKQTCIALAIKKVRFCQHAKDVEHKTSIEKAKTNKAYKDTNAETVVSDLYGPVIYQGETSLAAS